MKDNSTSYILASLLFSFGELDYFGDLWLLFMAEALEKGYPIDKMIVHSQLVLMNIKEYLKGEISYLQLEEYLQMYKDYINERISKD